MANQEGSFVGRYGDTLRRLTALQSQNGAFAGPQAVGGADTGGFGPSLQVQPGPQARGLSPEAPQAAPEEKKKEGGMPGMDMIGGMMGGMGGGGGGGMMSGGAGFTSGASAGGPMFAANGGPLTPGFTVVGEKGPEGVQMDAQGNANVIPNHQLPSAFGGQSQTVNGIAGPMQIPGGGGFGAGQGPVQMGGDKPTSFGDITAGADDEQKEMLAVEVEKRGGPGGLKKMFSRITDVLGAKTPELKNQRHDMALYVAEVALRAMSKRSDPAYAQNPDGVFADAVLETQAARDKSAETKRLEGREDTETKRKESRTDAETKRKEEREDTTHTRDRTEKGTDHERDRKEALDDDERNHKQALELAKLQAKLLRESGRHTSIQTADDGTLVLVDTDTGEAVEVTKEGTEEVAPAKGSRGKGTTPAKTQKVRVPVKAREKYDPSTLDQDTVQRLIDKRIADKSKSDRAFKRLPAEEQSRIATAAVMAEINAARSGTPGGVQSPGATSGKRTKFSDLK